MSGISRQDHKKDISKNLLNLFKENVYGLRCYHATRVFFPKKIFREGLKILSEKLIFKIIKQAGLIVNKKEKKIICDNYSIYTSIIDKGKRNHIYVQLDRYRDMLCEDNLIKDKCSFFSGGEIFSNILPQSCEKDFSPSLEHKGIPILIYIDLPISKKYINDQILVDIANAFFCSWFNYEILKKKSFSKDGGINIKSPIKGSYIKKILFLKLEHRPVN